MLSNALPSAGATMLPQHSSVATTSTAMDVAGTGIIFIMGGMQSAQD